MKAGTITGEDPAFLNLAGVLHESHGRTESARKFYQRALGRDKHCRSALENLARLDELNQTGQTTRSVAFGDDESLHRPIEIEQAVRSAV
jgi:Flp pilus assembly protein TadD